MSRPYLNPHLSDVTGLEGEHQVSDRDVMNTFALSKQRSVLIIPRGRMSSAEGAIDSN
jgi:hypothetical protein